jgi:hypothetical protein
LQSPIHGADDVAVGDGFERHEVVVEVAADEFRPGLRHEDDVFFRLLQGGVGGLPGGDDAEPGTDTPQENQKTCHQLHTNRDALHGASGDAN